MTRANTTSTHANSAETAPEPKPAKICYSVAEACEAVGISTRHFYNIVAAGDGPEVVRLGHRVVIPVATFHAWINAKRQVKGWLETSRRTGKNSTGNQAAKD